MIRMVDSEITVRVGRANVNVDADPSGEYSQPVLNELKRAVVTVCIAMDTEQSRLLATRIEGTP